MPLFDAHCDVLLKMWEDEKISFENSEQLHINWRRLRAGGGKVQCFAIFIPEDIPQAVKFQAALEMVDIFYERILGQYEHMKLITTKKDMAALKEDEIGAILTLEGCDAIGTNMAKLRTLFRLGVTSVGLTWNNANACADGVMESRQAGLTDFGRRVVQENNRHHAWTDVSHLSEAAFWDVLEWADFPIASHSNAKALCDHPRNLSDEQIRALLGKNGTIGAVFSSSFLREDGTATIDDVLHHIEHVCELGGERQLGFGSDFDGIEDPPQGLEHFQKYPALIEELAKRYSEDLVKGLCYDNFFSRFPRS